MKKILIITHYFPPHSSVASIRLYGIAKYLIRNGYEIRILTTKKYIFDGPQTNFCEKIDTVIYEVPYFPFGDKKEKRHLKEKHIKDNSNHNLINELKYVVRDFRKLVGSLFDIHDFWIFPAFKKAVDLYENEWKYDLILSSYSPPSTHIIASYLKKKIPVKWIADYRDLWSKNYNGHALFPFSLIEKFLEYQTVRRADAIITVSEPLKSILINDFPNKIVKVVRNGYDGSYNNKSTNCSYNEANKIVINYTGTVYKKQDPLMLFEAIEDLIEEGEIDKNEIVINFFGDNGYLKKSKIHNRFHFVNYYNKIPREEIIKIQTCSTLLLFLEWNDPKQKGVLTGKLFEYMIAGVPIISVGQFENESSKIIKETRTGFFCNDIDSIKSILKDIRDGKLDFGPDIKNIEKYSIEENVKILSEIIRNIQ